MSFHGLTFVVPAEWRLVDPPSCPIGTAAVYVGEPTGASCPTQPGPLPPTMLLQSLDVGPRVHRGVTDGTPTTLNGFSVTVKEGPSSLAATIPQYNVLVDIEGTDVASARAILATMRPQ